MKQLPPHLTPAQLKAYEVIERNRMAWTALRVVLGLFTLGFSVFIYMVVTMPHQTVVNTEIGGIDVLLGWAVKAIVNNLFPSKKRPK